MFAHYRIRIRICIAGLLLAAVALPAMAFKPPQRTAPIASIAITPASTTLKVGGTDAMVAVARDHSGHVLSGITFTWSSSNHAAAGINKSTGVASGIGNGTTVITAQAQGVTGKTIVAVSVPHDASGVAATGSPLSNVALTLVDSKGTVVQTTTANDGSYNLDTTGLTPPFLIAVQVDVNTVLYSVSADANVSSTINVDPLTDLIIRSWYGVEGIDMSTAFAHPASDAPPKPAAVQLISNVVTDVTALWLQKAGVDTSSFSPISTQFAADGTGVDAVLAEAAINTGTGDVSITDGTTSQDSTVTYDTGASTITVTTTTTNPAGSTSSSVSTAVAATNAEQNALAGVNAAFTGLATAINTAGSQLSDQTILPFFDDSFLDDGFNREDEAAMLADNIRGATISFVVVNIASLDAANGVADVNFTATLTVNDQSQTEQVEFLFKRQPRGNWLLDGDQRQYKVKAQAEMDVRQGAQSGSGPDVGVDAQPLAGLFSGGTVSADGLFADGTALIADPVKIDTFHPTPNSDATLTLDVDEFSTTTGTLVSLVPAGTPVTISLTPIVEGVPVSYTLFTNVFTTEPISITTPTGSTLADANLDNPLHVVWTLPTTFAIQEVKLSANALNSDDQQCSTQGPILGVSTTSADITIPSTCGGQPVTSVDVTVVITGVDGERIVDDYLFADF